MTTSLSAGIVVNDFLTSDTEVMKLTNKIYPVATYESSLPYVVYRRCGLEHNAAKGRGTDTVIIEVSCYAAGYAESVELAEAVRAALDYKASRKGAGRLRVRSITLSDSEEAWEADAYVQILIFKINV